MVICRWIVLEMRNVLDKSRRENQNTHFMSYNFFFSKVAPFYEIMWKKYGRARLITHDNKYGAWGLYAG
jgi:hypothetical protein